MEFGEEEGQKAVPFDLHKQGLGDLVLCLDGTNGNGDFVWSHLLMKVIREGGKVVVVSARNGPEHYESFLRKNGLDLRRQDIAERVQIKYVVPSMDCTSEDERNRLSFQVCGYSCEHCTFQDLQLWQKEGLRLSSTKESETASGDEEFTLFVDDLDLLEMLAPSAEDARKYMSALLHNLHGDISGNSSNKLSMLVALGAVYPTQDHGWEDQSLNLNYGEQPSLTEAISHRAGITATVSGLVTGHSNDVHGTIRVVVQKGDQMLNEMHTFKNHSSNIVMTNKLTVAV